MHIRGDTTHLFTRGIVALFAGSIALLLGPEAALAQATTIGEVICNVAGNLGGNNGTALVQLFDGIAYISGTVLLGTALLGFKEAADNPGKPPLYQPIARLIGGAGLIALPSAIAMIVDTLFTQTGPGGTSICTINSPAAAANAGIEVVITNFITNIQGPLIVLISIVAFTIGVFLIVRGLMKASKYGTDPRAYSMPNILANLVTGAILVEIGQTTGVILSTLFGTASVANQNGGESIVAGWAFINNLCDGSSGNCQSFVDAIAAGLDFFQLIGMIAFVRGFMIIKNAVEGSGQATMAQGFTHVFGGAMAINIYTVLQLFDTTFGTGWL